MKMRFLSLALLVCLLAACAAPSAPPPPARPGIAAPAPVEAAKPAGRLPPEIIQSVVRERFDDFQRCYDDGLRRNPSLRGTVGTRFVIGRDGRVTSVTNTGDDVTDATFVRCVAGVFHSLVFPPPEGGLVTVVYPIMFSRADVPAAQPDAGLAPSH